MAGVGAGGNILCPNMALEALTLLDGKNRGISEQLAWRQALDLLKLYYYVLVSGDAGKSWFGCGPSSGTIPYYGNFPPVTSAN